MPLMIQLFTVVYSFYFRLLSFTFFYLLLLFCVYFTLFYFSLQCPVLCQMVSTNCHGGFAPAKTTDRNIKTNDPDSSHHSSSSLVMLCMLIAMVDILCSSADVAGWSTPSAPSTISVPLKLMTKL